ncbi:MAG: DUF882 domain-containing protein [Pseudomonadota bacterium]
MSVFRPVVLKLGVAALAVVALALPAQEAGAQTRTLELYNTHTKERASITFRRNGRYDAAALRRLNHMLRDWRRNEAIKMDPKLFDLLWEVYKESGATKPIHVVSGYRSPVTNAALRKRSRGVAKNSQHTKGRATDFFIPGVSSSKLRRIAMKKQVGGVGFYPRSNTPFVHLDTGSVRAWPKMTRKQLVALFPDGRTLHVPSDGKPLKNYAAAQAAEKAGRLERINSGARIATSGTRERNRPATPRQATGTQVANANTTGGRNLLGAIFGGNNNDSNAAPATRSTPTRASAPAAPAAAPVQRAVTPPPLPAPRPVLVAALPDGATPDPEAPAETPAEGTPTEPEAPVIDEAATETDAEETITAPATPLARPSALIAQLTGEDVPAEPAGDPAADAAVAVAYAAPGTNNALDSSLITGILRRGASLAELEDSANPIRNRAPRVAASFDPLATLSGPMSYEAPKLTASTPITRTGDTRFFKHPRHEALPNAITSPSAVIVSQFASNSGMPALGRFEGQAITPMAIRRFQPVNSAQIAPDSTTLSALR